MNEFPIPIDRTERGQSLMEFAVSLVFVLILLAGVVDLGRFFFAFTALRDAAQEGAVYGSFCPSDINGIESRVRNSSSFPIDLSDTGSIDVECYYVNSGVDVACNSGTPVPGQGIKTVVILNDFTLSMPFIGTFIGSQTVPVNAEVTDTILTTSCP